MVQRNVFQNTRTHCSYQVESEYVRMRCFRSFISGCGFINLANQSASDPNRIPNDIVFNKLRHAKMDCCKQTKTAFADVQMALGWNFWCNEDYHIGLNLRTAAPAGNCPEACYLFEPIVGNGKHWEFGGGFTSHWTFWRSEDEDRSCAFYLDANVTHLFKSKQCRTFDLCCKPLSRYMLAAKFKVPVSDDLYAGPTDGPYLKPVKQFAGVYSPVANLTTIPVDVSVGVQGDLAFMLQYVHENWSFDLGYNFWGKGCEKIEPRCECGLPFEKDTWGLKGDAFMYGFEESDVPALSSPGIALSATQSKATLFKGTGNPPDGDESDPANPIRWAQNPNIDNRALAWKDNLNTNSNLSIYDQIGESGAIVQIYTSFDPVFINLCDVDLRGARTKGRSHKIFAHFDYTWKDREEFVPYLGFGFETEFAQKPCDDCCNNCCNPCSPCETSCDSSCNPCCTPCYRPCQPACCDSSSCNTCALSQWGIWIKGGFAFY